MNDLWGLAALAAMGVAVTMFVMPIVAWVTARRAAREVDELRREVAVYRAAAQRLGALVDVMTQVNAAAAERAAAASPAAASPLATSVVDAAPAEVIDAAPPEAATADAPPPPVAPVVDATPPPEAAAVDATPPLPPVVDATSPPMAAAAPQAAATLEEQIALVWFTRIGALVLLLGVAFFFKYAVDNDWIGPLGRVALGALAGVAILVFAEYTRPRTRFVYTQVLLGVGLAFLFLSAYASAIFYHLVPPTAALGAVAVIALLGGALAVRYRAEAVLILALLAGFASPVLLSTGEDRPLGLFAYLLVLTALNFVAALRMGFRWATWLGMAGPMLLFYGWYQRFFDATPPPLHPAVDEPIETLRGAYFLLAARVVPLAAVTAFFAEWLVVYRAARRRGLTRLRPLAILVVAALAAHAGFAALVYDRPLGLGLVLSALALATSELLGREGRRELVALPLGASFLVLVLTLRGAPHVDATGLLALLGLWGAVYARAFLAGQLAAGHQPSPRTLWLVGAVGLGIAITAGLVLAPTRPLVFFAVMVALSLGYALLGLVTTPWLIMGAVMTSLAGLMLARAETHTDVRAIAVAAVWAATYLGSIAYDLVARRAPAEPLRVASFSLAGLGFALLAESHTASDAWLVRALILAAVGVVDLAAGAYVLQRSTTMLQGSTDMLQRSTDMLQRSERRAATMLLGQALALFAGAVAFVFSGATLTLVWAAMAAVGAVLAGATRDRYALAGALALFAVALGHLVAVDLDYPARQATLYMVTNGAHGAIVLPPFVNPRAYALVGSAVALLVAARALAAQRDLRPFAVTAALLTALGHMALVVMLVGEVTTLAQAVPRPPSSLGVDEVHAFIERAYWPALELAKQRVRMLTTLVWGCYAAVLVGIGFGLRDRLHRYLGLGLFALALGKLGLYDVWQLPRVYQMLVLVIMGALLLGASFLYARFGKRLVELLRDGGLDGGAGKAALLLVAIGLAAAPRAAHAFEATAFELQRPIERVSAPGLYRVELDPELYRRSRALEAAFADVRIAGPGGVEVPYLVRPVPVIAPPQRHSVTLVDPVRLPDGSARAVLDLGAAGLKHSEVTLALAPGGDFFSRARVEVSGDERAWAVLAEGAYVYRVSVDGQGRMAGNTRLSYPLSDSRYLRVTLLAGHGSRPPAIDGAEAAWVQPESRPPLRLLPTLTPVAEPAGAPNARSTAYVLDLGAAGVPISELAFDIGDAAFERRVAVGASNHRAYWAPEGAAMLYRAPPAPARARIDEAPLENVRVFTGDTRKRYLRVEIYNGDNQPLDIRGVSPAYRAEELVFRAPAAGDYTLYFANPNASPPAYDLAAVLARSGEPTMSNASFGSVSVNPTFGHAPAPPAPLTERLKLPIGIGLGMLLLALALWTVRLMRRARD